MISKNLRIESLVLVTLALLAGSCNRTNGSSAGVQGAEVNADYGDPTKGGKTAQNSTTLKIIAFRHSGTGESQNSAEEIWSIDPTSGKSEMVAEFEGSFALSTLSATVDPERGSVLALANEIGKDIQYLLEYRVGTGEARTTKLNPSLFSVVPQGNGTLLGFGFGPFDTGKTFSIDPETGVDQNAGFVSELSGSNTRPVYDSQTHTIFWSTSQMPGLLPYLVKFDTETGMTSHTPLERPYAALFLRTDGQLMGLFKQHLDPESVYRSVTLEEIDPHTGATSNPVALPGIAFVPHGGISPPANGDNRAFLITGEQEAWTILSLDLKTGEVEIVSKEINFGNSPIKMICAVWVPAESLEISKHK